MIEFFNYLNSLHPLSAEATAALMKVIHAKELRKGQVWLQEGAVCDKMTFVVKGLAKTYFESGAKEVCLQLARENEVILAMRSYFTSSPSNYSIRMVEPTIVVYVSSVDLHSLVSRFPEINIHLRLIMQVQAMNFENHAALLMYRQSERFAGLVNLYPWMVDGKRLTDRVLSAYLGMTPASLCGFKKG